MKTSIRTRLAASALTLAAAGAIAVGVGAGTATADDPNWPNYKVGPYQSIQECESALTPYIRVSGCLPPTPHVPAALPIQPKDLSR